MSRRQQLGRPR